MFLLEILSSLLQNLFSEGFQRETTGFSPQCAHSFVGDMQSQVHGGLLSRLTRRQCARSGPHLSITAGTDWQTHPLGQTLIVTAGCGRAQRWGGPVEDIRPGDVTWIPPGEKLWHGAGPTTAIDPHVDWMEHVTEEQLKG